MPDRNHRIELSSETKDSLVEVRDKINDLLEKTPEIVGVTIFGSNIKGTARSVETDPKDPSDLDGTVFVDLDKLGIKWSHQYRDNGLVNNDLTPELETHYQNLVDNNLGDTFPAYEIKPEFISEEIIREMVHVLIESGATTKNNDISFQRSETLSKLFRFSFGTESLSKYRLQVLDELEKQTAQKNKELEEDPDNWLVTWRYSADDYWKSIMDNLYYWEFGDKNIPWGAMDRSERFTKTYPQTIKEARDYWGLHNEKLPHGEAITVFRATQETSSSGTEIPPDLAKAINFEATENRNIVQVESSEGTFFCAYSKPAWYVDNNRQFKIIDLMVVAESEELAITQFEKAHQEAEEIRSKTKEWVQQNILPKLTTLKDIALTLGRGDIYDKERVPNGESDIDILLFVDFPSKDYARRNDFKENLKVIFGSQADANFRASFYEIQDSGFSGGSEALLPHTQGRNIRVGLDIISIPDVLNMVDHLEKVGRLKKTLNAYAINAVLNGEVLATTDTGTKALSEIHDKLSK